MTFGKSFFIETIVFIKDGEKYGIAFDPRRRAEVARTLGRWASDPELNLTWPDAAGLNKRLYTTGAAIPVSLPYKYPIGGIL